MFKKSIKKIKKFVPIQRKRLVVDTISKEPPIECLFLSFGGFFIMVIFIYFR